jgi:hypothetical protein
MWPFKKKEKKRNPKTDFDYFLCGIQAAREIKEKYPMPRKPIYIPSIIIHPK